ncbi:Uncharacterized conserved protein [Chromobacterium violaceum]|uniref:Uncharacterized conserved protein n=1 Tax=Chromobacterium violaceum TaxID=536 RepID=A0A447TAV6_CHRVL|nr:Uncharacterized conserved protein [Chromobacterium violaceum]
MPRTRRPPDIAAAMRRESPLYIPRNHLVEEALDAASERGDMGPTLKLLEALHQPFAEREEWERYALPAEPELAEGIGRFVGRDRTELSAAPKPLTFGIANALMDIKNHLPAETPLNAVLSRR